jgi:nucleoside-diphosphate-sugar epimerase
VPSPRESAGTVLVTGASGFVGGHLVERLAHEGRSIRALMRPGWQSDIVREAGAEIVVGDLSDCDALDRAVSGVDVVIHLAAIKHAARQQSYVRVNEGGCANLADAIRRLRRAGPSRVVYLSSYAAGGPSEPERARAVTDPPAPLSYYGASKLRGERCLAALAADAVSVVVVRAPVVYGPRDRDLLTLFRFVRRGWAPLPAGRERRVQLLFASDLAAALARAAETRDRSVPSGLYAVADPIAHTWSAALSAMAVAVGTRVRLVRIPTPLLRIAAIASEAGGMLMARAAPFNRDKAKEMIASGWVCDVSGSASLLPPGSVTSIEAGMAQTVKWYRDQRWLS